MRGDIWYRLFAFITTEPPPPPPPSSGSDKINFDRVAAPASIQFLLMRAILKFVNIIFF